MRLSRRHICTTLVAVTAGMHVGCGTEFPRDPRGSLRRITDGELRAGISPNPPWTSVEGDPGGSEADLVRRFAQTRRALVAWTEGGEEHLMEMLHHRELDLVVGGLTKKSPWIDKAALTRPYTKIVNAHGETEYHVWAVMLGENALLNAVERFLQEAVK